MNARASALMSTEGLSRDAAIVLAMTERPTTTSDESIDTTYASDWQAQFSLTHMTGYHLGVPQQTNPFPIGQVQNSFPR